MSIQTIEAEAESVEKAKQIITTKVPQGYEVFSEEVVADEKPKTRKASGATVAAALASAEQGLPKNAEVVARRELSSPITKTLTVDASNEDQARTKVISQLGDMITVKSLRITQSGRKGWFGIGQQPQQYQIEVIQNAAVEIIYKTPANVIARIGRPKDRLLALAEGLAGGWPAELNRENFERIDLDKLVARLKHYQEMAHPCSPMERTLGIVNRPNYQIVNSKITRSSLPAEDCKLVTTAAMLSGRDMVNPMDERNTRYAMEIIEHYVNTKLAKFLFYLPRLHDNARLHIKTIIIEEHLIDIYKGVENVLFEIYEELGNGQVFTDQTVTQKLLSIAKG